MNEVDRFMRHVETQPNGCWRWMGAGKANGYGIAWYRRRVVSTHRIAYELFVGPIPDGKVIDHLCHSADAACLGGFECPHRRCVNPAHLEAVTQAENLHRGHGLIGMQVQRDRCGRGHLYGPTPVIYRGARVCQPCVVIRRQRTARLLAEAS